MLARDLVHLVMLIAHTTVAVFTCYISHVLCPIAYPFAHMITNYNVTCSIAQLPTPNSYLILSCQVVLPVRPCQHFFSLNRLFFFLLLPFSYQPTPSTPYRLTSLSFLSLTTTKYTLPLCKHYVHHQPLLIPPHPLFALLSWPPLEATICSSSCC